MRTQLSLRTKIAISAALALIAVGCVVAWLSYSSASRQMEVNIRAQASGIAATFSRYVADWFDSKARALESFPGDVTPERYIVHLNQVKVAADVDNVFLGFEDGSLFNANELVLPSDNNDPRVWNWYMNAKRNPHRTVVEDPTVASATGKNVVSLGRVVHGPDGRMRGVIGADVELDAIIDQLRSIHLPGGGSLFIATRKGTVFSHADQSLLNARVTSISPELTPQLIERLLGWSEEVTLINIGGRPTQLFATAVPGTELILVMLLDRAALTGPVLSGLYQQLLVILLLVVASIFLLNWLIGRLFLHLNRVSSALAEIASGGGDLTSRLPVAAHDEVGALAENFNRFAEQLRGLVLHVRTLTTDLDNNAKEMATRAVTSVRELTDQQEQIGMVTHAMNEMTSATAEIAHHAENTADAVRESAQGVEQGKRQVDRTGESISALAEKLDRAGEVMGSLNERAQEITGILSTIQSIAEQTNLLALNAAIEAARAGEQGRGFAVVADEVRVLSQRTHASTEEIQTMIGALHTNTKNAVEIMGESRTLAGDSVSNASDAAESLKMINDVVASINGMASQIATAAEEQSHVVQEVLRNVEKIHAVAERSLNEARQGESRAKVLEEYSQALNDKVAMFRL